MWTGLLDWTDGLDYWTGFHPVLFDTITAEAIRKSALLTEGSAGPSGMDALYIGDAYVLHLERYLMSRVLPLQPLLN